MYNPLPKTLDDLKANLEREIKKIPKNVLNSVFFNLEKRCELIISAGGILKSNKVLNIFKKILFSSSLKLTIAR